MSQIGLTVIARKHRRHLGLLSTQFAGDRKQLMMWFPVWKIGIAKPISWPSFMTVAVAIFAQFTFATEEHTPCFY